MVHPRKSFSIFQLSILLLLVLGVYLFQGCGGGGGSSSVVASAGTLSWDPPAAYLDGTLLDPATDLDSFEIYVNENGSFWTGDKANAAVAAYDPGTNRITTSFNLANLSPYFSQDVVYHVSVRVVAKNGLKSDFSPSAAFSF